MVRVLATSREMPRTLQVSHASISTIETWMFPSVSSENANLARSDAGMHHFQKITAPTS